MSGFHGPLCDGEIEATGPENAEPNIKPPASVASVSGSSVSLTRCTSFTREQTEQELRLLPLEKKLGEGPGQLKFRTSSLAT